MKKLEEIDSLGVLLENKVGFQRLIDNILENLIETFHNKWKNMFESFELKINDSKLFPCIVSFDMVDGFQVGIQFIQPLYYTLDKEFDFNERIKKLESVTIDDVHKAIATSFDIRNSATATVGSKRSPIRIK